MLTALHGHRRDIDGIRAIAVLSVLLFHFGLGVAGGFVGVDVFFVLSGFLIGSHIYTNALSGTFSFADFYHRRARRIVPALLCVLVGSFAVMWAVGTPRELMEFSTTAAAAVLSVSNITLYRSIDYFNPSADLNPLLMTWSLGVEEQFYIVAPFVLLMLTRLRISARLPVLAAIALLSFADAIWMLHRHPTAAFYLLVPRAWELAAGVMLGMWSLQLPTRSTALVSALSRSSTVAALGVLWIGVPVVLYRADMPFPGLSAMPPIVGTVLLLSTRHSAFNQVVLGNGVMGFFGRISYSLYLWHWPLISIGRVVLEREPPLTWRMGLLATSILLGWISHRWVETPFRRSDRPVGPALARYALVMLAVCAVLGSARIAGGFGQRWPADFVAAERGTAQGSDACLAPYGTSAPNRSAPCGAAVAARVTVALVGDSHASAMAPGVNAAASRSGMAFAEMTKSSCPFLHGVSRAMRDHPSHVDECAAFNAAVLDALKSTPSITTVVIAGYWRIGLTNDGPYTANDRRDASATQLLQSGLSSAIRALRDAGKSVIVLQDVPYLSFSPTKRLATCTNPLRRAINGYADDDPRCEVATRDDVVLDAPVIAIVADAARRSGATLVDPAAGLCDAAGCRFRDHAQLYYSDRQHLSTAGAMAASAAMEEALRTARP